jgi:ankyrin repeat protein
MTLDSVLSFLRSECTAEAFSGQTNGRAALSILRSSTGNLNSLEHLCACNGYHEVPKKAKKGQPPNLENEDAIKLRSQASTALYELTVSLNADPNDVHLREQYASIPSIIPNLCQGLKCLLPLFEGEETREGVLAQLSNVLYCLSSAVSSVHAPEVFACGAQSMLLTYMKEKTLAVHCLNIIYKLNLHSDGFTEFSLNPEHRQIYIDTLTWTIEDLVAAVGAGEAAAPDAKGKDAKGKAAKPAKGADPAALAAEEEAKANGARSLACQMKLLAGLFLIMSTAEESPLSAEEVGAISTGLLSVSLNTALWKMCNAYVPAAAAPAVALEDTISVICSLLGSFAQRPASRGIVCASTALDALGSILLSSRTVCDVQGEGPSFLPEHFDSATEEFPAKRLRVRKTLALFSLRRVAEKAMLHLMTHAAATADGAAPNLSSPLGSYPWEACSGTVADAAVTGSDTLHATVAKLVAAIVGHDTDLANRIARLLSGVVQCSVPSEGAEAEAADEGEGEAAAAAPAPGLCATLGLNAPSVAAQLSSYISARAEALQQEAGSALAAKQEEAVSAEAGTGSGPEASVCPSPREINRTAALKREAEAVGVSVPELLFFKWEGGESRSLRAPRLRPEVVTIADDAAVAAVVAEAEAGEVAAAEEVVVDEQLAALLLESKSEAPDYLFAPTDESLAHGLFLLEALLPLSAEMVAAGGTPELVSSLAGVMRSCGPTGSAGAGAGPSGEHMVSLSDPRVYNWREEHDRRAEKAIGDFYMVPVRGLAAAVLTLLAQADAKYRRHEGEACVPCAPQTALPPSSSAGYAAASLVCKLASDVCFASLLAGCRLSFSQAGDLTCSPAVAPAGAPAGAAPAPCTLGLSAPPAARQDVVHSLLTLVGAIGSCGLVGLSECYAAVAAADDSAAAAAAEGGGGDSSHFSTSLSSVKACIRTSAIAPEGEDVSELLDAPMQWAFPLHFEYFSAEKEGEGEGESPLSAAHVLSRRDLWPFVAVAAGLVSALSDPRSSPATATLAAAALGQFSSLGAMGESNQPAAADLFSAVLVALGGCTALVASVSCYGVLAMADAEAKAGITAQAVYIISRGATRQAYWHQVAADKAAADAAAAEALEAAGGKGKKDDKKAAKDDKKAADKGKKGAVAVEEEKTIELPIEPDGTHPDPCHGPTTAHWAALLNMGSSCYASRTELTTPLSALCQGMLCPGADQGSALVLAALLAAAVDVDRRDGAGVTPLMYALAIGNASLVSTLLEAHASPDAIDGTGVPTLAYAFASINAQSFSKPQSLLELVVSERRMLWADTGARDAKAIGCSGTCDYLDALLERGVDLQVCTAEGGNFPLHFACGYAELGITIGGVRFLVDNKDYSAEFGRMNTAALVGSLIDHGADPRSCNRAGVLPIHIVAASGDVASAEKLLRCGGGELSNVSDAAGFLPLHYAAAACPRHAFEIINALLKWGDLRPLTPASFQDARTALSAEDKYWHDLQSAMTGALSAGGPSSAAAAAVSTQRVTRKDLVRTRTLTGLSPLHLVLAGRALAATHLSRLLSPWDNIGVRVAVAEMFMSLGGEDMLVLSPRQEGETEESSSSSGSSSSGVAATALSAVHTMALLGVAEEKPNSFMAGSLRVCRAEAAGFSPPSTEREQQLFVKFVHGNGELCSTSSTNTRGSTQCWNSFAEPLFELNTFKSTDLSISVWSGEPSDAAALCIGTGSVSLGAIVRGQMLVGEEITLIAQIHSHSNSDSDSNSDSSTGTGAGSGSARTHIGSVSVALQTVVDAESRGISGPIFSNSALFTRILKSVDNDANLCNSSCSWDLSRCSLPGQWTPLHACIVSQNRVLATALIGLKTKGGIEWSDTPYLQFVASRCHNMTFCGVLIEAYQRLKPTALNKATAGEYPLHAAVRSKNAALVNALVDCPKVNLNAKDAASGATAFLEACRALKTTNESDIFAAFARNSDRLDFLIADNDGETCIDFAIRNNAIDLVDMLCDMRRNDVVEKVTAVQTDRNEAILLGLEKDNLKLTKIVHASLFAPLEPVAVAKTDDDEEEEEEQSPVAHDDMFPTSPTASPTVSPTATTGEDEDAPAKEPAEPQEPEMSVEEAEPLLAENEKLLASLLKCVVGSGVAPPAEFHVHECFAAGLLLRAHQEGLNAESAEQAQLAAAVEAMALSEANARANANADGAEGEAGSGDEEEGQDNVAPVVGNAQPEQEQEKEWEQVKPPMSPIKKELGSFNDDTGTSYEQA